MSHVGFLAEEPDCDAGSDADEASVKADGTDCLFVHFTISSLPILLLAYFSKERFCGFTNIILEQDPVSPRAYQCFF